MFKSQTFRTSMHKWWTWATCLNKRNSLGGKASKYLINSIRLLEDARLERAKLERILIENARFWSRAAGLWKRIWCNGSLLKFRVWTSGPEAEIDWKLESKVWSITPIGYPEVFRWFGCFRAAGELWKAQKLSSLVNKSAFWKLIGKAY